MSRWGCALEDAECCRNVGVIDALECDCRNERDRVGNLRPKVRADCRDLQYLLPLIGRVRQLLDEPLRTSALMTALSVARSTSSKRVRSQPRTQRRADRLPERESGPGGAPEAPRLFAPTSTGVHPRRLPARRASVRAGCWLDVSFTGCPARRRSAAPRRRAGNGRRPAAGRRPRPGAGRDVPGSRSAVPPADPPPARRARLDARR
jgi:hypothetical protein